MKGKPRKQYHETAFDTEFAHMAEIPVKEALRGLEERLTAMESELIFIIANET